MLELILLYFGLNALITGSLSVGGGREATGVGARIAGAILCLPLPVSLLIVLGTVQGVRDPFSYYWNHGIWLVELGILFFCAVVGYMVAGITASYTSRGYGRGEMRYRTESRDDIVLPKPDDRPPPSIRKGGRGLSRRPREEESERAIRGNLAEDRLPRARRHRDPQLPVYFWPLIGGIGLAVLLLVVILALTLGGGDSPPNTPT